MDLTTPTANGALAAAAPAMRRYAAEELKAAVLAKLTYSVGKNSVGASNRDWFLAVAFAVRDIVVERWIESINATYDDGFASNPLHWMIGMADQHNAGVEYNLYEGNIGPGIGGDCIHGNQLANTLFRNYLLGSDPGRTDATIAITLSSYNRYHNVVGNVLGTPGYTTRYEVNSGIGQSGVV